jgi:cardiolipin synthase
MLDPIADKLLVALVLLVLAWDGSLSGWLLVPALAILFREIFISGLREYLGAEQIVVHVTQLAKWKTTIQLVAITLLILAPLGATISLLSVIALLIAALITLVTGFEYMRGAWPHFSGRVG